MAEINVAADPSLGPQPFDGGVHDDGIRDQVQAEDLIRLLTCLTALYLPFRERRIGSGVVRGGLLLVQLAVDSTTIILVLNPP